MMQEENYAGRGGEQGTGTIQETGAIQGTGSSACRNWKEEDRRLERRQKRQFSHVGLVAATFMLVTFLAQIGVLAVAEFINRLSGGSVDFYTGTGLIAISAIPMYLVAFPVTVALIQFIPRCGAARRERWGLGKFIACLVISIGIGLAGMLLSRLVEWIKPSAPSDADLDSLLMNSAMWVNVLVTVILAPVVEELLYRKLLMDRLIGYGEGPAVLMSGLMFGLAHGNFSQFFYAFGIGILWAYVYARTGRVGYTIAFHMIFNLLGGVITMELAKGLNGAGGPWWLQQIGQSMELDFSMLISGISAFLIIVYYIFMFCCLIGGITLLILYRRQIRFSPGQWPIRKGRRFRTVVLNVGMVLYFLICGGLFLLNW